MKEVDRLLKDKKYTEVKAFIEEKNPADIAAIIDEIFGDDFEHEKEFLILFRLLPKDTAAEVFTYMHTDMQEHLIEAFSDADISKQPTGYLSRWERKK